MTFDAARKRIYITGTLSATVIEERDPNHYELIAEVPTAWRAKTSFFIPELDRLCIAALGKDMICGENGHCTVPGPLRKPGVQMGMRVYEVQPRMHQSN